MNTMQHYLTLGVAQVSDTRITAYSGRGMIGKSCIALTGSSQDVMTAIAHAIVLAHGNLNLQDYQEFVHTVVHFSEDNMGRYDIVVYWPGAQYEQEQTVDGEEDEE